MTQFLHLQGLIIIKKINNNIGVGINSIIEALVNKLTVINNLIEQNLL